MVRVFGFAGRAAWAALAELRKKIIRLMGWALALAAWLASGAALLVFPHTPDWVRWLALGVYAAAGVLAWRTTRLRRRAAVALGLALLAACPWFAVRPAADRAWSLGQERTPRATTAGDIVTIENVRNAAWRSASEVDMRWETRRYDLRAIRTVDLVVEPFDDWRGLAHIFVTFGFEGGEHVAISIESRREAGESYSPTRGLFRHYELLYIIGDERDLIGLRANIRRDPVYVFPTRATPQEARALFVAMVARAQELGQRPEFYNTLTATCATGLLRHVNEVRTRKVSALDWRIVFPGYADELAWDLGLMQMGGTLDEARARYLINERSAFEPMFDGPTWSRKIRIVP